MYYHIQQKDKGGEYSPNIRILKENISTFLSFQTGMQTKTEAQAELPSVLKMEGKIKLFLMLLQTKGQDHFPDVLKIQIKAQSIFWVVTVGIFFYVVHILFS